MQPPADAQDLRDEHGDEPTRDGHGDEPTDAATVADPASIASEAARPTGDQRVPAPREEPPPRTGATLTERDEQILAFERQWWKHAGAKEQAVRDAFGLSATRYYQLLNALLDNPAALERDPVLVARLRRLRSARARTRRR